MNLNSSRVFSGILTSHNSGRSVLSSASKQPKEISAGQQQRHCHQQLNLGKFYRENCIQVDLLRNKIKLEIKEERIETDSIMDDRTNHQGNQNQMTSATGPRNNLRRDNSDSDISVGSNELHIVEDVVNVETVSDEDEKVEISDEELERMFAQKDREINFLRTQVKDLKKTTRDQGEKITNLNKLVQKHETVLNRIVEVGGGTLLENVKYELKAIQDGDLKTGKGPSSARPMEQATRKSPDEGSQSESSTPGTPGVSNMATDGSAGKDKNLPKRNKAVTFGATFYEGETPEPQPRQFYQHKRQRDWHPDEHRGKRRRDWFLHDDRAPSQPYNRQATKDPYYLSPTSNRPFRARGQGQRFRGRGAQFNCRFQSDPNMRSNHNNNYYHHNNSSFNVTSETSYQMNQNINPGYNGGGGVNEEEDFQPGNKMEEEEVFQCPYCPWKFGERQNMEKHCEVQHKQHKCEMCGKEYGFQESLRRHLQSEHGI